MNKVSKQNQIQMQMQVKLQHKMSILSDHVSCFFLFLCVCQFVVACLESNMPRKVLQVQ